MNGILIKKVALQASVQDLGRGGFGDIGLCEAGALDEGAFNMANALLGNKNNESMLEIALGGCEFVAKGRVHISLSGGLAKAFINDEEVGFYQSHTLNNGDILTLGFCQKGQMIYMGIKGGFNIAKTYKSQSTSIKEGIGGLDGAGLKSGDFLPVDFCEFYQTRRIKNAFLPDFSTPLKLRLVASYQYDDFAQKQKDIFFASEYKITPQSNRMACKLKGEKILVPTQKFISEPIAYGAIQIPTNGNPIVLLKERQTIGGYPKIGCVIAPDCFSLAQKKQGSSVYFELIDLASARKIYKEFLYTSQNINA